MIVMKDFNSKMDKGGECLAFFKLEIEIKKWWNKGDFEE